MYFFQGTSGKLLVSACVLPTATLAMYQQMHTSDIRKYFTEIKDWIKTVQVDVSALGQTGCQSRCPQGQHCVLTVTLQQTHKHQQQHAIIPDQYGDRTVLRP